MLNSQITDYFFFRFFPFFARMLQLLYPIALLFIFPTLKLIEFTFPHHPHCTVKIIRSDFSTIDQNEKKLRISIRRTALHSETAKV